MKILFDFQKLGFQLIYVENSFENIFFCGFILSSVRNEDKIKPNGKE